MYGPKPAPHEGERLADHIAVQRLVTKASVSCKLPAFRCSSLLSDPDRSQSTYQDAAFSMALMMTTKTIVTSEVLSASPGPNTDRCASDVHEITTWTYLISSPALRQQETQCTLSTLGTLEVPKLGLGLGIGLTLAYSNVLKDSLRTDKFDKFSVANFIQH